MISQKQDTTKEETFSFKDTLVIIKGYFIEVLKHSWLILILALLLGKFLHDRKMSSPTTYTAVFSFALNEVVSENKQSIASLFGAGGAGGGESTVSFKKLKELITTRKIFLKLLFHELTMKHDSLDQKDYLINHYLRLFYYKRDANNPFYFETDSIDPYDKKSNHLLKYVHNSIVRNHLIIDPVLGSIMNLKVRSVSEDFSYELITALYKELNLYYDEKSREKQYRFYLMAEDRTNQLRGKLSEAEINYINYVNQNGAEAGGRNNILIKTQFLATELKKATESYFLALSSREAAWVTYEGQKNTASMSVIDPPLYPLVKAVPNPFLHLIAGLIIGGGFGFFLIIIRKFLRDFMAKENEKEKFRVAIEEKEEELEETV
jgi:hypothetical protein